MGEFDPLPRRIPSTDIRPRGLGLQAAAVREAQGGLIEPPLGTIYSAVMFKGFQGSFNQATMMPRGVSISESYTADC